MDRRGFLKLFGAASAAAAAVPLIPFGRVWSFPSLLESLFRWRRSAAGLIVPVDAEVPISIATGGNFFLQTEWITAETLRILKNHLVFASEFHDHWGKPVPKRFLFGSNVQVNLPQRFTVADAIEDEFAGIDEFGEY